MTSQTVNAFRATLETRLAELIAGCKDRHAIAIDTSPDELDRIQQARDRDQSINRLELDSQRLREVRDALRRIGAHRFGTCLGCEEEISLRRLEALPWASYCIHCQEAAERELPVVAEASMAAAG